jgi:hypothetical protein
LGCGTTGSAGNRKPAATHAQQSHRYRRGVRC